MRVVAFDVGARNLARCVLRLDDPDAVADLARRAPSEPGFVARVAAAGATVEGLEVFEISFDGNLNRTPVEDLVAVAVHHWDRWGERMVPPETDRVVIEAQTMGRGAFNPKMKILSHCLQAWCELHAIRTRAKTQVGFVSAKHKLSIQNPEPAAPEPPAAGAGAAGGGGGRRRTAAARGKAYRARKSMAVDLARAVGRALRSDTVERALTRAKADDLADALLHALVGVSRLGAAGAKRPVPEGGTLRPTKRPRTRAPAPRRVLRDLAAAAADLGPWTAPPGTSARPARSSASPCAPPPAAPSTSSSGN